MYIMAYLQHVAYTYVTCQVRSYITIGIKLKVIVTYINRSTLPVYILT